MITGISFTQIDNKKTTLNIECMKNNIKIISIACVSAVLFGGLGFVIGNNQKNNNENNTSNV